MTGATTCFTSFSSPVGELTLSGTAQGLEGVWFDTARHARDRSGWQRDDALFAEARATGLATVAIGGIDRGNAHLPIEAGADAVAVITDLFGAGDPAESARTLHRIVHAALARRDDARR